MNDKIQLRVLVYKDVTGFLVARCLENNLVAQARSVEDLQNRIIATIVSHLERDAEKNRIPFFGRQSANSVYEKMFNSLKNRPHLKPINGNLEAELAFAV